MSDYTIEAPDGTPVTPKVADTPFLAKIRKLERSGDYQTSSAGAKGRFQITQPTAEAYGIDYDKLSNAEYNEESAKKIAAKLEEDFPGDEDAQVVAWNAGPKRAKEWIAANRDESSLPKETQGYLDRAASYGKSEGAGDYTIEKPDEAPKVTIEKPKPEASPVAKPGDIAADLKKMRKTPLQLAEENVNPLKVPAEGFRQGAEAQRKLVTDLTPPGGPIVPRSVDEAKNRIKAGLREGEELLGDIPAVAGGAFISGVAKAGLGTPITNSLKALSGGRINLDPQMVGDVATLVIPGVGEAAGEARLASRAKASGTTREAVRANEAATTRANTLAARVTPGTPYKAPTSEAQAKHQQAARRLQSEGTYITPGNMEGGQKKVREDREETGNPYTGPAVAEARQKSVESYNRVGYNRALSYLDESVDTKAGPVGHEGMAHVESRFDAAYGKTLARAQTERDPQLTHEFDIIRQKAASISRPRRELLNDIIGNEVTLKFDQNGKMDGRTFKKVESELRRKARGYEGDPNSEERDLGKLVNDVANALRESVNRHSPPEVVRDLRKIDSGYAVFKRLQRATAYSGNPEGVFTPKELATAIRVKDNSLDKSAFAKGDALLQDLSKDGQRVLPNKVRDPGTAAQLKAGIAGKAVGGIAGAVLGGVTGGGGATEAIGGYIGQALGDPIDAMISRGTNALRRRALAKAPVQSHNYLRAADRRAVSGSTPRIGSSQLP